MKVLFDHGSPFIYAHGGFQIQIEQTLAALRGIGVDADYLKWWDDAQEGDVVHYFGRAPTAHIRFAQGKGMKYVMSELLTGQGSRSLFRLRTQRLATAALEKFSPRFVREGFRWESFRLADAAIALTPWEAQLMQMMFAAPAAKVRVVPNGVEEVFFLRPESEKSTPKKNERLVCTATITERKRVLELAQAAVAASIPIWIIGRPYAESDSYYQRFLEVVREGGDIVRYEGGISDRAQMAAIYKAARGFVLLSTMESLSLSALEAAAAGCPLLLSDLPWARCTFGDKAAYCPITSDVRVTAKVLQKFHKDAPGLPLPARPKTWHEVALQLKGIYEEVLAT